MTCPAAALIFTGTAVISFLIQTLLHPRGLRRLGFATIDLRITLFARFFVRFHCHLHHLSHYLICILSTLFRIASFAFSFSLNNCDCAFI